ncbi:conserved hypothetical protein [Uncinocarpus reesii 1704]|uniref:Uncharacterized protein n=1 Tax=Uncinocarpus reesii (strain UAMH 1704) TaxID=336963 RepID=C4JW63_UNCRE|nr:uncharacterized protein UREG_06805 [Uncinocarpus reesii 1704]EEP81940.1 conserved hypothetical protein [Uncinocarpus reesii 1704]
MDDQIQRLVDKVWTKLLSTPPSSRYMVAISGIPGSGKTSLAKVMTQKTNAHYAKEHPDKPPVATWIAMDGYHLTRAQLAAMPDPVHAMARRGAAFTFDPVKFTQLVRLLRADIGAESATIYAPSFDHAVKDPVENDVPIPATARVVFFEGNYLSLNKEPWTEAARLMDELWFVEVDFEVARKRLVKRHVEAGIAKDEAEADKKAVESDLVNGREIVENRLDVAEVIVSREDAGWL